MSNTWILFKAQIKGVFTMEKIHGGRNTKGLGRTLLTGLIGFSFLVLWAMVFGYYYLIGEVGKSMGTPEITMGLAFAGASVFVLVTTIYKGASTLFNRGDYDILMPLPVAQRHIAASKLLLLYAINLLVTLFFLLPAVIIYAIMASPSLLFYPLAIIGIVFLPVVPMLIGTLLSLITSILSSRFRHNNIINILLMLVFFGGVFYFSFSSSNVSEEAMVNSVKYLWSTVYATYPPTKLFIEGICDFNLLSMVIFVLGSGLIFMLFADLVGVKYKSFYTMLNTTKARSNYKMGQLVTSSPLKALYKKELKRYLACPMYVVNTGIGALMLAGGAIFLAFNRDGFMQLLEIEPAAGAFFATLAPAAIAAMVGMSNTTGVSISLEGVTLPLTKMLPISGRDAFLSKILVNLTITVPAVLIAAPIVSIAFGFDWVSFAICLILPLCYGVFSALFGLAVNLNFPMLTWTNEVVVVKQSMSAMISMLGGMGIAAAMGFGLYLVPAAYSLYALLGVIVLLLGISALLWRYLTTTGSKLFYKL